MKTLKAILESIIVACCYGEYRNNGKHLYFTIKTKIGNITVKRIKI